MVWTGGDPGTRRRGFIAGAVSGMRGGLPTRRGDQEYSPPVSPGTPGSQSKPFRRLVISGSGPGSGLFLYSPSPGKGNLIIAESAAAATDPYGNIYPVGFNIGVWSAAGVLLQHFGVNLAGDVFLVNSTPLVIFHGRSSDASFFFYNSFGEGLNNLASSIVAGPGTTTDAAGNTAQPGIATYNLAGGIVSYVQLINSLINFQAAATAKGQIGRDSNGFFISDTTNSRSVYFQLNDSALTLRAITPGTPTTLEPWHAVAPVAGFAAGGTSPRFQFEPINGGRVRLSGAVNLTANQVAGTTFFTLPANFIPSRVLHFVTQNNLSGFAAGNASLTVDASGHLQITVAGTSGNFVALDGVCFELD